MALEKMNRRDALKVMGAGFASVAMAGMNAKAHELEKLAEKLNRYSSSDPVNASLWAPEGPTDPAPDSNYKEKVVYKGPDITFRQIDEHTWEGNGHLMYNESVYIVEGSERALVIDAGTRIPDLDKIVAGITQKPVTLVATHVHPDHTGSSINLFPELHLNAADEVLIPSIMPNYTGKKVYLSDGQVFDLGGREIEVLFTPGHTPGSCTFFDKERHYGFSGDSFGSTNLLLMTNFSTLKATTYRVAWYMEKWGIEKLYPGHYSGDNVETLKRVKDELQMAEEMLEGLREGVVDPSQLGLNGLIHDHGVNIRYNTKNGIK